MLFSTYWKCLLTDGDICWQTLPHFDQKEGRESKDGVDSNGNLQRHEGRWDTKTGKEEDKREINQKFNFSICPSPTAEDNT